MEEKIFHKKLSELYTCYNTVIKPLIADIESKQQEFPDSLFNEIRAFNDHIARCYMSDFTDDMILSEINRAESHIIRITLDCYKYLAVWFDDYFKHFKVDFDISLIDNGEFAPYFYTIQLKGRKLSKEAKSNESYDKQLSYEKYQEAYNVYSELYKKIDEILPKIQWARKFRLNFLSIIISAIVSGIITAIIPWSEFINWISSLFHH